MNIRQLSSVMGSKAEWTGKAHRFYAKDANHYDLLQDLAAAMQRAPKAARIRWWSRGATSDNRRFVEVAMH